MQVRDAGAEVLDALGAEMRAEGATRVKGLAAQVAVEETAGPGVAGAGGVVDALDLDRGDAVELGALGDPGTILADFHGGDATEAGELAGIVVETQVFLEERLGLVLVGEDDVDALLQLGEDQSRATLTTSKEDSSRLIVQPAARAESATFCARAGLNSR